MGSGEEEADGSEDSGGYETSEHDLLDMSSGGSEATEAEGRNSW